MPRRYHGMRTELALGLVFLILTSSTIMWGGSIFLTRQAFDHLVEENDLEAAGVVADALGSFYEQHGSWQQVVPEIYRIKRNGGAYFREKSEHHHEYSVSREQDADDSEARDLIEDRENSLDQDKIRDLPMILTDPDGLLIYNGFKNKKGEPARDLPSRFQTDKGRAVMAGGKVVAWVLYGSMVFNVYKPREETFIASLGISLGAAVLAGILFAVVLGILLASRFVRPLIRLEAAVKAIAAGDLASRVQVRGSNEVVSLSHNFNIMAERLLATETARQNLIADVTHELRTPVSIIQGNLEMMIEGVYQPDKSRLVSLYEETRLLSKLIGDLRTVSDLESGMALVTSEPVPLYRLLADCSGTYAPFFAESGMSLSLYLHSPRVSVLADADRITQVVRNILDNALKYAPPKGAPRGAVTMTTSVVASRPDSSKDAVKRVRVSICDEGPGVPEGELDRIFERFYRLEQSRNRESGGRGLGLAICKQFVEACGGTMGAANRSPHGLCVWFELPEAEPV